MKMVWLRILVGAALVCGVSRAAEKLSLKVVKADSEETAGEDGKSANAVDGDPATIWHTQWQDASPGCPHEIILQLSEPAKIVGVSYLPRQDDGENGMIKDFEIYVSEDGKSFSTLAKKGTLEKSKDKKVITFPAKQAGFVKLVALSEVNDQAWTSAAEIGVLREGEVVVKPSLKVAKVDSEETAGEDGKGANTVDGNRESFWHTQWQDATPGCPHEIVLQLDSPAKLKGLTYLPRQDGDHGRIKEYEVYLSDDGKEFGAAVAKGTWENDESLKKVSFDAKSCGFVKLKALSEVNGEAWTSAAEIDVVPAE